MARQNYTKGKRCTCGVPISNANSTGLCTQCFGKSRRKTTKPEAQKPASVDPAQELDGLKAVREPACHPDNFEHVPIMRNPIEGKPPTHAHCRSVLEHVEFNAESMARWEAQHQPDTDISAIERVLADAKAFRKLQPLLSEIESMLRRIVEVAS